MYKKKKQFDIIIIIILALYFLLEGKDLSGELTEKEYLFNESVIVQLNDTLIIPPGTELYFDQYCQLEVYGTLICNGTEEERILFSTVNEKIKGRRATAMDWNGIKIHSKSNIVSIKYTDIKFSTFGIDVEDKETKVQIFEVNFSNSGVDLLTVDGEKRRATENSPVYYSSGFDKNYGTDYNTINHKQKRVLPGSYLIDGVLNVDNGDTLIVDGPCTIYFTENSSMRINGSLLINQEKNATVHLTSIYNNHKKVKGGREAMPGDWLGICVSKKADIINVRNCNIEYSKVGFNFEDETENTVTFDNVDFGRFNGDIDQSGNIILQENVFYE